jgi:hypothetical protein
MLKRFVILSLIGLALTANASAAIDEERLVDAIGHAENSKSHPYGILTTYKHTTPRQACLNTVRHALKNYSKTNQKEDFIIFLSRTYSPIGAKNDPNNLNVNWVRNVTFFYNKTK